MTAPARVLAPALRQYRGSITDPARWSLWTPRPGDIVVCTPPKCGTTWTQTMLAMLVHGGPALPGRVPELSPWIDADLGAASAGVAAALAAQQGRRVVKTHTPADGFPIWEGVTLVAVYRHPLDVFFSLRKHNANWRDLAPDDPMLLPPSAAFRHYLEGADEPEDLDSDSLATLALHYRATVCAKRLPDLKLFHYSDMIADGRGAVAALARAVGIDADSDLVERVAAATAFGAMKAKAEDFTPLAGTGLWKSDVAFFDSASSGKWQGRLSDEDLALYRTRLAALLPDPRARAWLEDGDARQ